MDSSSLSPGAEKVKGRLSGGPDAGGDCPCRVNMVQNSKNIFLAREAPMQKIVVPVDFSAMTEDVLEMAKLFAGTFAGELHLIHVMREDPSLVGYIPEPRELEEPVAEYYAKAYFQLQEMARQLRYAGYLVFPSLFEGEIIACILEKVREIEAELIIMGAHNKGALSRLLLGSVSEGVLRKVCCPVIVIPARKYGSAG